MERIFCVGPAILRHGHAAGDLNWPEHPGQKVAVVLDLTGAVREDQTELAIRAGKFPRFERVQKEWAYPMVRVPASDFGGPNLLNRSTRRQT